MEKNGKDQLTAPRPARIDEFFFLNTLSVVSKGTEILLGPLLGERNQIGPNKEILRELR